MASNGLASSLARAQETRWSGVMVVAGDQTAGNVLMHEGRVAWAQVRDQQPTLATYLRHVAGVTPRQFFEVQRRVEHPASGMSLREALDVVCRVREPVLRMCLMLHIQIALAAMTNASEPRIQFREGGCAADENLTFAPVDVLPSHKHKSGSQRAVRTSVFAPLVRVAGYLGAAVVTSRGELLLSDVAHRTKAESMRMAGYLTAALEASTSAAEALRLGRVDTLMLECEGGAIVARWLDENHERLAVMLLDSSGRLGSAKTTLAETAPALARAART